MHSLPILGYTRRGKPIYPIAGGDITGVDGFGEQVQALTAQLELAVRTMEESKDDDATRWGEANKARIELGEQVQALVDKQERDEREASTAKAITDLQAFMASVRNPSQKAAIGGNLIPDSGYGQRQEDGAFLLNLYLARSSDAEDQMRGKAGLRAFGLNWQEPWGLKDGGQLGGAIPGLDSVGIASQALGGYAIRGKATLATSDATGQAIVANALVDTLSKPARYDHPYRSLMTVIDNVTAFSVEMPVRAGAPTRAAIAAFGATKENRDLAYLSYTATMYTMALIYDIGKQFLRQSAGAAEQDVLGELAHAFALGESYYVLSGSGSSQPYGLLTALTAATTDYTTSHTAANTTIAGSAGTAIAKAAKALALRNRVPTGVVCNAGDYWTMVSQGADAAGFYIAGNANGPATLNPLPNLAGGPAGLRIWGLPVYPDTAMTADRMVIGDWKAAKLYLGESYRVDSSDVAGERWDKNLVGFRGEMELGFDARPSVLAGAFQEVTDFVA